MTDWGVFMQEVCLIKFTAPVESAASQRRDYGLEIHCTHTHGTATHKALLPSHLSFLQVTGVGYAQSPPSCVMVRPSPWTRAWSPFRTMDSSFHRAMFSWPSPTNSATAWDLRSVVTLWCDYACSSIVASNINLAASWIHEVMMYNLSEK